MNKTEIKDIKDLLSSPKRIVIIPHKNPDGDAVGSTLGLLLYLKKLQHDAVIIAPNDYPDFLKWMPSEDRILKYDSADETCDVLIKSAELIFTLDFNDLGRIGDMTEVVKTLRSHKNHD